MKPFRGLRPFKIGHWTATPDDSGERDGWWISEPDGRVIFVQAKEVTKLRRLIQRVEASEAKRAGRRAR
jgi:hypothetical protein